MKKFYSTNSLTKLGIGLTFISSLLFLRPLWAPPQPPYDVGQQVRLEQSTPIYDIKLEKKLCKTYNLQDVGQRIVYLDLEIKNSEDKIPAKSADNKTNLIRISVYHASSSFDPDAFDYNVPLAPPDKPNLYLRSDFPLLTTFFKSQTRQFRLWFKVTPSESPSNVYVKADVFFRAEDFFGNPIMEREELRVDNSLSFDVTSPQECEIDPAI